MLRPIDRMEVAGVAAAVAGDATGCPNVIITPNAIRHCMACRNHGVV